ncbi:hypothetical protein [Larkinella punicea]|uniref:Uncharacterized protein n=1 Tax=Larkinella punicea TaxID=2315727 RepID=A0A368JRA3_9BACT|nr:hypothetical protein [Larkinella punicea]RCR69865.1 hypothetical protein DUE52_08460 [Larkinella punicea]
MHRGVIHYDELTECGLFKDASGQIHIFRKGDPVYRHVWTYEVAEKPPVGAVMPVIQPDRRPLGPPLLVEKPLEAMPRASSAGLPPARVGLLNWIGMALSGLALLLLINIGGEPRKDGVGSNPKLIDSMWAVMAGVLLLIELIYFSVGAARWRIRTNYWGIVVCTVFASLLMRGCDHYEADKLADVYTIVLAILLLIVYLLPKQKNG